MPYAVHPLLVPRITDHPPFPDSCSKMFAARSLRYQIR